MIVMMKSARDVSPLPSNNPNPGRVNSGSKQQNSHRQAKRSAKEPVGLQRFLPVLNYGVYDNYIPFKKGVKAATHAEASVRH